MDPERAGMAKRGEGWMRPAAGGSDSPAAGLVCVPSAGADPSSPAGALPSRASALGSWLLSVGLIGVLLFACDSAEQAAPRRDFVGPAAQEPSRAAHWPSMPSLSEQQALREPANLLSADPLPSRSPSARSGGVLRRGTRYLLPSDFLWLTQNIINVVELNRYVMEPLARRHQDEPTRYAPAAAESITLSEDGRTYTVRLRPGMRWATPPQDERLPAWSTDPSQVHPLTSRDYAFAFEMIQDEGVPGSAHVRAWYGELEQLEVLDELSFRLHWRQAGFAAMLWTMELLPLPEHLYAFDRNGFRYEAPARFLAEHWFRWPAGAGPYRATIVRDSLLRLERFDDYQGEQPALDAVEFISLPDKDLLAQLQANELDFVELTAEEWLRSVALPAPGSAFRNGKLRAARVHELVYDYIGWNLWSGVTQDRRVRLALALAVDRERLLREVFSGVGRLSPGPYSSMTPFADPQSATIDFEPERAKRLLEDAGYLDADGDGWREDGRGQRLSLRVLAYGRADSATFFNPQWAKLLFLLGKDWEAVGVELQVILLENEGFERALAIGGYEGYVGGWGHFWEDDLFELWHSSQSRGGANRGGYRSREADRIMEAIRRESDASKRLELHHLLDRQVREDLPYLFLFEQEGVFAWRSELRGVHFQLASPRTFSQGWWLEAD